MVGDAGSDNEPPVHPAENSSGWTFNWWGLLAVLLIVAVAAVAWRWLGGSSVSSNADDSSNRPGASATSAPTDSDDVVARSTTPTTAGPAPTTALPSTTTTTIATDRQVRISGEMKPCRFGANCLVAGFTIEGFDEHPGRFICIYPNSRSDFSFNNQGVDEACITADAGDTITIEVDGVSSLTISEENLDGT